MATAPSPNDLTRQQLDELDALLQKMLTGAPAPVDTPPPAQPMREPPVPPLWRADPPAPVAPPAPHLERPEPPLPLLKFEPPAPKPAPAPVPVPVPVAKAPAPKPVAPAPPVPAPAPKPAALTPPPPVPEPVPLLLKPFALVTAIFDGACGLFGPPGRLLRGGFFKHIYGLAGLGLLAYTAARVAQVQGWVTLPVDLPWPK
jgi:hypothetical protein